jgi:hypothetical protein
MESFCEVGEGDAVVVDDLADGADDADVVVGVSSEATSAHRRREDSLLSPAVNGVSGHIELTAKLVDRVHWG